MLWSSNEKMCKNRKLQRLDLQASFGTGVLVGRKGGREYPDKKLALWEGEPTNSTRVILFLVSFAAYDLEFNSHMLFLWRGSRVKSQGRTLVGKYNGRTAHQKNKTHIYFSYPELNPLDLYQLRSLNCNATTPST